MAATENPELRLAALEVPEDAFQVGDEIAVLVTEIDRERRRLALSRRQILPRQQ